ncbi:MAG: hypothetical protein IPM76_23430 [Chloroflexi bacterium]|nr:hypothetical protein [Chloroflexota bacterium]
MKNYTYPDSMPEMSPTFPKTPFSLRGAGGFKKKKKRPDFRALMPFSPPLLYLKSAAKWPFLRSNQGAKARIANLPEWFIMISSVPARR